MTTQSTHEPITVTDGASWQRAIARGAARTGALRGLAISGDTVTAVVVSERGLIYHVTVVSDRDGQHASCTCQAGTHQRPCWHVGAVLSQVAARTAARRAAEPTPGVCRRCGAELRGERGTLCGRCALAVLNGDD